MLSHIFYLAWLLQLASAGASAGAASHHEFATLTYATNNPKFTTIKVSIPDSYTLPDPTEPIGSSTTAPAKLKCTYQDKTPEQAEACICESGSSTTTVKPISIAHPSVITQSCDISTWPGKQPAVTDPPAAKSTNWPSCQVCTIFNPTEGECNPLPADAHCTPSIKPNTISMATGGASVGTLTGTALYAAITKGIDSLCAVPKANAAPSSYTCDETKTATIASDILYEKHTSIEDQWDMAGSLEMQITAGNYNSLKWYNTAKTAIAALAQNSTEGNCKKIKVENPRKRDLQLETNDRSPVLRHPRDLKNRETPTNEPVWVEHTVCKAGNSFQFIEYDPISNTHFHELQFTLRFVEDNSDDITCEFLIDALGFVEAAINAVSDTEAALPEEMELNEELLKKCKQAMGGH